jgi:hypothetical protein
LLFVFFLCVFFLLYFDLMLHFHFLIFFVNVVMFWESFFPSFSPVSNLNIVLLLCLHIKLSLYETKKTYTTQIPFSV